MKGCRPLKDSEIKKILNSFWGKYANRDRALFVLGCKSGFRVSELLSLRIQDVYQHGEIVDRVTIERRHMKKHIEGRTVLLHPDAKKALTVLIDEMKHSGQAAADNFLFQSRKGGKSISRVQAYRILKNLFDECGINGKVATHSMRKTFADRVYKHLGNDIAKTQKALGHKSINSTVSYLSFSESEIDDAILAI